MSQKLMAAAPRETKEERVAIAIDKDKASQYALKWAADHVIGKGQTVTFIHVKLKTSMVPSPAGSMVRISDVNANVARAIKLHANNEAREAFLPFRCFCGSRDIKYEEIILEDTDIANAIIEYISRNPFGTLVLGASPRSVLVRRFKGPDVPTTVSIGAPEFTSVYVISKGKILSSRVATRPVPPQSVPQLHSLQQNLVPFPPNLNPGFTPSNGISREDDKISSASSYMNRRLLDQASMNSNSQSSTCSGFSTSFPNLDGVEAEMRRLRLELKQIMEMYNTACNEALTAKKKANELQVSKIEELQRVEEARLAEEAAITLAEKERAKCRAALEAAEAAQKLAELEAQRRSNAENKAMRETEQKKKAIETTLNHNDVRYRRYTIEEIEIATDYFSESLKVGEGGYGPVYKCTLDHTQVAVKVLRPDAAQGQSQFHQEVEILSCIRHPNMVLLLGACPEYGCLVYEYMHNGSLDDRLFCRGNTPPLPWQIRFIIAAEIGTGLLFLHQRKPEPLVHRDLKPANILLDRNFVSKISDVGLARLVPPSVADVTEYRMTQAAGTFCYIDPEYQQTGMLGIKSDIYSLGIIFLQLITAKPPMGLAHHMERAIDTGTFAEFLDQSVPDWPIDDTLKFAKLALACAELRRKDRPDLAKVVLPELSRLRELAEQNMPRT